MTGRRHGEAPPTGDGRRVAVIGLDGVGLPLVRALATAGVMPRLAAFLAGGAAAPMRSTIPTISNVSWAAFLTGMNPGRHGIYGFTDVDPTEFRQYFPSFRHLRAPTVFDVLGERGLRAVVANVPGTYPAREIDGVLISGFVAVHLEKAVYPPSLLPALRQAGYKIDVDYARANERPEAFFTDLLATLEARRRVFLDLAREQDWSLFIAVITETDRLHHYFWHAWEDRQSPYHPRFVAFYAALDVVLGDLLDALGDVPTMIVADHGHMLIDSEFYPNAWLRDNGYLSFRDDAPRTIADIDRSTRAFVLDPGRVYLNLEGRYPTGSVRPAEAEAVLSEVAEGLAAVRYGDRAPVAQVFRRDELYHGQAVERAPDMVLHFAPGFDIKGALRAAAPFGRSALTGMHTYDDALFCASNSAVEVDDLAITDIAPTVVGALGLCDRDLREAMDGVDRRLA